MKNEMVRRNDIAVPMIALLLGLIAAGLSFIAYAKRIKVKEVRITKEGLCMYPNSPAFEVGILAAVFILTHQVLISSRTGCFCCGKDKFPCNICGIIAFILFALSWLSFVITFVSLIGSSIINYKSFLRSIQYTSKNIDDCLLLLKGSASLFLGAAIWCFITMFFTLSSYATFMCGVRKHRHNVGP